MLNTEVKRKLKGSQKEVKRKLKGHRQNNGVLIVLIKYFQYLCNDNQHQEVY